MNRRLSYRFAIFSLTLAVSSAGCADSPAAEDRRVLREDSAGVELVRNTGGDRPLEWAFEPVLSIGGADEGPEAFFNIGASGIAMDDDGVLYVLDSGNHRVVVFDREGRHVRTMGRRGGGPGELEFAYYLYLEPDGVVAIHDFSKGGLVRFGSGGESLPTRSLPYAFGSESVIFRGERVIGVFQDHGPSVSDSVEQRLLSIGAEGDTIVLARRLNAVVRAVQFRDCAVSLGGMPPVFEPRVAYVPVPDGLAVSAESGYRIDVLDLSGALLRAVERDHAPEPVTRALAAGEVTDTMRISFGAGECRIPPEDIVEARGFAPVVPAVRGLVASPDGTLWVQRGVGPQGERRVDVLGPDGDYLGTLPPGTPWPAAFRGPDEVIAIERDDLGLQRVVVYRIRRGA